MYVKVGIQGIHHPDGAYRKRANERSVDREEREGATERLRNGAEGTQHFILLIPFRGIVEARDEDEVTKNEDAATVVVTLRLDVGVSHQEHREDDCDDIPAGENQPTTWVSTLCGKLQI